MIEKLMNKLGYQKIPPVKLKPEPEIEEKNEVDFGHGFIAKKLINDKWTLTKNGYAYDLENHGFKWKPMDRFFKDCMGSFERIERHAKDIMSYAGILKE